MKNMIKEFRFPVLIAMLAIAVFHTALGPAPAGAQSYEDETTTTTESTTTTTTVAPTTTVPTTVPTPTYNATASADALCAEDGNVVLSITFRGEALDDGGNLLILLDDVEVADLVYSPGMLVLEEGQLSLNQPSTDGGTVTFVVNTTFGDFAFTAEWPAVPLCPLTSSTSIVRNNAPGPSYSSTTTEVAIKAPKEPRFTG